MNRFWRNRDGWIRIIWSTPDICFYAVERPSWWIKRRMRSGGRPGILWLFLGRIHLGIRF